jgi:serine phosphatase RsbU (regulator of sigma subunit)
MTMPENITPPDAQIVLSQELAERETELALINSVQLALASKLDVQSIYNLVGDKIRDIFDSQVVMISTYDPTDETIEHRYAIEHKEHIYAPGRYPIRGFRTKIVQTRQPVLVNTNVGELAASLGQHTIPGTLTPKSWLGVPMIVGDQVTGILSLQNLDRENAFDASDVRLLQTLAASMSIALENARLFDEIQKLYQQTEQRATELRMINVIQEGLAKKLDKTSIFELVGEKIQSFFELIDITILIYDPTTDLITSPYQVEQGKRTSAIPFTVAGKGFIAHLLHTHQPLVVNENMEQAAVQHQHVYSSAKLLPKSVIYVPLLMGEEMVGAIVLTDMQKEHRFSDADVGLLMTLANAMSVALENARLWEQEKLFRKALEREFEIGREIQAGFLPGELPQPDGWEIAVSLKSAREVTGDFYDAFELPDGKIGLVIADVCDKGLGAALFMTLFRSLVRAMSNIDSYSVSGAGDGLSPEKRLKNAITFANNYFAETHGQTSMFCTIFFGILDPYTGVLIYIDGGHLPPIMINQQGIKETLNVTGPAVGLLAGASFLTKEVIFEPGDTFFAHTDGLTDTISPDGENFNRDKLVPLFMKERSLDSVLEIIQDQVKDYSTGAKQFDDITMLAVRRKER